MIIRSLLTALVLCLAGCGSGTPAPDYPAPTDPALEETSLGQYVEDESTDEVAEEDDSWDHPAPGEESAEGEDESAEEAD